MDNFNQQLSHQQKGLDYCKYKEMPFDNDEEDANQKFLELVKTESPAFEGFEVSVKSFNDKVYSSKLYAILSKMPKASLHHIHLESVLPSIWFFNIALDDCNFVVNLEADDIKYTLNNTKEVYKTVKILMDSANDKLEMQTQIENMFKLRDEDLKNPCIWNIFSRKYINRSRIATLDIYAEKYILDACKSLIEEEFTNVQMKFVFKNYRNKEGKFLDENEAWKIVYSAAEKVAKYNPNFILSIICAGFRVWKIEKIKEDLEKTYELKKKYPNLIAAFDLSAGECYEQRGLPIKDYIEILLENRKQQKQDNVEFPFCIHAGETTDINVDTLKYLNLVENARRMGHGINLFKFAPIMEDFRKKGTCVEVNPMSNHILGWVKDLRLHPGITYYNFGVPIVISSDDPGILQTNIMWDYMACTLAFQFDLKDLKRLQMNSIEYSLLGEDQKNQITKIWKSKWVEFIKLLNSGG
jgi:adenosine deaminase CECR1